MAQNIEVTLEEAESGVEAFEQLFQLIPDDITESDENMYKQLKAVVAAEKE